MRLTPWIKSTSIAALVLAIAACATVDDKKIAASFADQRAEMLNKIVPVNMNGYNLINAKSVGSQIELTLLYSGKQNVITPQSLSSSLTTAYCNDTEVSSLMQKGVNYKLLFRDSRGRFMLEHKVNNKSCSS